jgi:hypothetical protein
LGIDTPGFQVVSKFNQPFSKFQGNRIPNIGAGLGRRCEIFFLGEEKPGAILPGLMVKDKGFPV